MEFLGLSLFCLLAGGALALVFGRSRLWSSRFGVTGSVLGSLFGLAAALQGIGAGRLWQYTFDWSLPGGSLNFGMDPLSAFFLFTLFLLSGLISIFGRGYLAAHAEHGNPCVTWFHFNLLVASMAVVFIARNALLFLIAWEIMAISSFFLVSFEHEKPSVREAGFSYLVATHLGTAFLLLFFVLLAQQTGSFDFGSQSAGISGTSLLFLLALVGFGSKAGIVPLHVWLPEAHPAAPSHVSALMSGVMIKTGIYGLLRAIILLGPPPAWWGWCLIGIGLSSGFVGVLFALAQHDLKRLLAYSSVENIGIVFLGLGLGLLGWQADVIPLAVAGFAGALLHILNHAVFKGLLFLNAGAVLQAVGRRNMDSLGGLYRRMPLTGLSFLAGSVAIAGLPPLSGFVSEFLIFRAGLAGVILSLRNITVPALLVIGGLALISGLAAACFARAFGIIFLGEPRSLDYADVHDPSPAAMRLPLLVLAGLCLVLGLGAPWLLPYLGPVISTLTGFEPAAVREPLAATSEILLYVSSVSCVVLAISAGVFMLRSRLLTRRKVAQAVTWDCGYAAPSPRMQYTGASLVRPVTALFQPILADRKDITAPMGIFPAGESRLATHIPEPFRKYFYDPLFQLIGRIAGQFLRLQHGNIHLYLLYIAATLFILLIWKLGGGL